MKTVVLCGEVNDEMVKIFVHAIIRLAPKEELVVYLHSGGGVANSAIAIAGLMRRRQDLGHQITVIGTGEVQSAAVLILAAGSPGHRKLTRGSWAMVHEDSGKTSGTTSELERVSAQARREEINWNSLMEAFTGLAAENWDELAKAETFMSPEQCLKLGLIDEVI